MIALNLVDGRLKVPDSPFWLTLTCSRADQEWQDLPLQAAGGTTLAFAAHGVTGELRWTGVAATRADFEFAFAAAEPVRLRLALMAEGAERAFHVIPACLLGDNNHDLVRPKEFPTLHEPVEGNPAAAPLWEFRADRTACPVSLLCLSVGVAGLAVAPYADDPAAPEGFLRNGVWAALPATAGVSLGYGNDPLTFGNKQNFGPPTAHRSRAARTTGSLFWFPGAGRAGVHRGG
ncbi:MAG: hypothetical protein ACO3DQ_06455, partial [Cephaloticoccus sp.]